MKTTILIFIFSIISAMSYGQVGQIFFSSSGGSNPNVASSLGEPFSSSGGAFGVGSRKNTDFPNGIKTINEVKDRILLFPNPTENRLTVQVQGANENNFNVKVFNLQGRILIASNENRQSVSISLKDYANGAYQIAIFSKDNKLLFDETIVKQ